jgi:hypothetical protein
VTGGEFLLSPPHRQAIRMETSPVIVVDKLDPLRAVNDRPPAVKAVIGRPTDDPRRHPSGDACSIRSGERLRRC